MFTQLHLAQRLRKLIWQTQISSLFELSSLTLGSMSVAAARSLTAWLLFVHLESGSHPSYEGPYIWFMLSTFEKRSEVRATPQGNTSIRFSAWSDSNAGVALRQSGLTALCYTGRTDASNIIEWRNHDICPVSIRFCVTCCINLVWDIMILDICVPTAEVKDDYKRQRGSKREGARESGNAYF